MIAELVMRLFHARTAAHVMHLQTTSYAKHKALNEFYDAIVDFADSIAEGYQGEHGMIDFTSPHRYATCSRPTR
jgi:DNA-binding ferritin-like protein